MKISKKRYIRFQPVGLPGRRVEQYFGLSHLHHGFQLVESIPGEVYGDDQEHLGCDGQANGI
jgi:hypothetical protein